MLIYLYKDIAAKAHFIPGGLALGLPVAIVLLCLMNRRRRKMGREPLPALPFLLFCISFAFVLVLTLLSRESGSVGKPIDLELFSTLKINKRNNAYAVENVLLFLPLGLFAIWNSRRKSILAITFAGGLFSLAIETLQLVTARGFFQLDDILTNMLGAFLGAVLYRLWVFLLQFFRRIKRWFTS